MRKLLFKVQMDNRELCQAVGAWLLEKHRSDHRLRAALLGGGKIRVEIEPTTDADDVTLVELFEVDE